MRILFMGTPDFAVPSFTLLTDRQEVVGLVTQPDKPSGRGYTLTPPPVKVAAAERGIPVFQPETLKNEALLPLLRELNPDLIAVVAYGKILPRYLLDYPKHGCINLHGSLLPKYRGAAPMQRAIMEGESSTGVTTMLMADGIDTGDMLLAREIPIGENDNLEVIHDRLASIGAELLCETVDSIDTILPIPQDDALATHAAKIEKEDCLIDFARSATEIHNLIRGLSPVPLAFTTKDGMLLKIIESTVISAKGHYGSPGEVYDLSGGRISVACGDGAIAIHRLLPQGKGRMKSSDYINGRKIALGDRLGS